MLSITFKDYFKFYAGSVIHFGKPNLADSDLKIKGPFFPGTIGFSAQTPPLKIGKVEFSLVQDIVYTFYRKTDRSNLSFKNGAGTGIVFSTGIRVTLPGANLFK